MAGQDSFCPVSAFETGKLEVFPFSGRKRVHLKLQNQHPSSLVIFTLNLGTSFPFPQQTESAGHRSTPVFGSQIPIWCVQLRHLPNLKQNHYHPVKLLKITEVWPKTFGGFYEFHLFPLLFAMEIFWLPGLWRGRYVGNKWFSWYCLMMTVEHQTFHRVIANSQRSVLATRKVEYPRINSNIDSLSTPLHRRHFSFYNIERNTAAKKP